MLIANGLHWNWPWYDGIPSQDSEDKIQSIGACDIYNKYGSNIRLVLLQHSLVESPL